jgi:hypothetical protein
VSQLSVNTITNAAGGNTAQINGMTPTAQSLQGFRNRLINSDMRIDQRNAGASVTANGGYTLDRWEVEASQTSKLSIQQQTSVVPIGFTYATAFTSLSAYSVVSADNFGYRQIVEGFNVADLGWGAAGAQTVTLSFWVRSSLTGTFGGAFANGDNNRAYPFSYTISAANTWEQKTVTVPGDTTGTWGKTSGRGIQIRFGLGAGATYSGTAGAWVGSDIRTVTGAVSVVGTSGATFYITGVQLEAGSVATPFERRPYGTELQLAMRYFETGRSWAGGRTTDGTAMMTANFKQTKRAAPTMVYTVILGGAATGYASYTDMAQVFNAAGTNSHGEVTWTSASEL